MLLCVLRREFEHNANVAAARALMQQGLRHCRTDEGLWAEYLRMELLYVARLRARREVLGLPNPGTRSMSSSLPSSLIEAAIVIYYQCHLPHIAPCVAEGISEDAKTAYLHSSGFECMLLSHRNEIMHDIVQHISVSG